MRECDRHQCEAYLMKGQLCAAMGYLGEFPSQKDLFAEYVTTFEKGECCVFMGHISGKALTSDLYGWVYIMKLAGFYLLWGNRNRRLD